MKILALITLFFFQNLFSQAIRDIFNYDTHWDHADYDIVAHGHVHQTGKAFKVLQCGHESKIVIES